MPVSETQVNHPPDSGESSKSLSARAWRIFAAAPRSVRLLQSYRPFICPFEELLPWVRLGDRVLDVGCGSGLWLGLLADLGRLTKKGSIGFDASARAIEAATAMRRTGGFEGVVSFVHLDLRLDAPEPYGGRDVVSIVDVMHHVPMAARRGVLSLAAERVRAGGTLIYKDMTHRSWRAWMNRLHDLVMAREWVRYTPAAEVEAWARECGLKLVHGSHHRRWWYGHDLRVFVKGGQNG